MCDVLAITTHDARKNGRKVEKIFNHSGKGAKSGQALQMVKKDPPARKIFLPNDIGFDF